MHALDLARRVTAFTPALHASRYGRLMTRSHAWSRPVVLALALIFAGACTHAAIGSVPRTSPPPGLQPPEHPYGPFPYASAVQHEAFDAYIACAADHGVRFEGPYADAGGKGALIKLAPGQDLTNADRDRMGKACPQLVIATLATPPGPKTPKSQKELRRVLHDFATCVRSHGYPSYPPVPTAHDPFDGLSEMSFPWGNPAFVKAASACMDPVRGYVFTP